MTIQVGDRLPDVPLTIAGADGPQPTTTGEFFGGKRVALFAVPGAFTPTCSARHLPSFVDKASDLKGRGIDEIACVSVNDPFVMAAWGQRDGSSDITMLADGNGAFAIHGAHRILQQVPEDLLHAVTINGRKGFRYAVLTDDLQLRRMSAIFQKKLSVFYQRDKVHAG